MVAVLGVAMFGGVGVTDIFTPSFHSRGRWRLALCTEENGATSRRIDITDGVSRQT